MQRVRQAAGRDRQPGRVQGLRRHLAPVEPRPLRVGQHARAVQVLLDVLEVEQLKDRRLAFRQLLPHQEAAFGVW